MELYDLALNIFDFMQAVLNAQGTTGTEMRGFCDATLDLNDPFNYCPASSFTAIGAAFSTMGYWVQSDLLDHLTFSSLGTWAPLIYIISAVAGMFGVALGQPPRNYVWFFVGPALYAWLIDTRIDVDGVAWRVANQPQNQKEVWKLAEVGLMNTNLYQRMQTLSQSNDMVTADSAPRTPVVLGFSEQPRKAVAVALPFLWFDWLISGTVDSLVQWTGIYRQNIRGSVGSGAGAVRTNVIVDQSNSGSNDNKWYLLSNLKWTFLEDISSAKLGNSMLRAAWAQFIGSECGEALSESIDTKLMTAAVTSRGGTVPTTIFRRPNNTADALFDYSVLKTKLRLKHIPNPAPFKRALSKSDSFQNGTNWTIRDAVDFGDASLGPDYYYDRTIQQDSIRCDHFLDMLILMFRFETGSIYNSTFKDANISGLTDLQIIDNILNGWDLKRDRQLDPITNQTLSEIVVDLYDVNGLPTQQIGTELEANDGAPLTQFERFQFIHNLILLNLMRNEMALAPPKVDTRYAMSQQAMSWMQAYQANVGGKVKFMELYTWAILIPYLQGILMYFLAMMYPVACMMVIMPGQHKWIITWASFWAWVKLWDLGFAIVMSLERSIWAMIGNNAQVTRVFDRIVELDRFGTFESPSWNGTGCAAAPDPALPGCEKWNMYQLFSCGGPHEVTGGSCQVSVLDQTPTVDMQDINLRFLDMALAVGSNLDLGLANSYYIYIMAALYMAVPAVTGQLVLGARSGAASMVNSAIGGVSQEGGRQAGEGFKGKKVQDDKTTEGSMKQAVNAKAQRKSGMAAGAIAASNNAALESMRGDVQSQMSSGFDRLANAAGLARQDLEQQIKLGAALGKAMAGGGTQSPQGAGPTGRAAIQAATDKAGNISGGPAEGSSEPSPVENPTNGVTGANPAAGGAGGGGSSAAADAIARALKANGAGGISEVGGRIARAVGSGSAVDILGQAGIAAAARENYRNDNFYKGMMGNSGIQGFGHQQAARASGDHGQRMREGADFAAEQGAWMEMTEWASNISGAAVAQGAFGGSYAQGPMPTSQMGMAMNGLLGSNVQAAARYMDPASGSGFMAVARGQQAGLQAAVGKSATDAKYQERGIESAFWYSINQGKDQFLQVGTRSGQQGQVNANLEPSRK